MSPNLPTFRTQYDLNYKAEVFAAEIGEDEGLVQQHMKDECDVNVIMKRYQQTGELTHVNAMAGEYGDYSDVTDYYEGTNKILAADSLFMSLPATIRDQFNNDPGAFIDFASDKANIKQMRDWGLAPQPPIETINPPSGGSKPDSGAPPKEPAPPAPAA